MSEIDTSLMTPAEAITRAVSTNSSKKQAWLKELEQARQLSSGNQQTATRQDCDCFDTDARKEVAKAAPGAEDIWRLDSDLAASSILEEMGNSNAGASNNRISAQMPVNLAPNPQAGTAYGLKPASIVSGRTTAPQPASSLEQLEGRYKAEFKPQNMKLIAEPAGVRVLFRDYRLDGRSLQRIVSRLRKDLKELGIPVSSIVINGKQVFDNNII